MTTTVGIQVWLLLLLIAASAWALFSSLLMPGVRWFLRRRVNRAIERVNTRLQIEIQPIQYTKKQILADRVAFDPAVVDAVRTHAAKHQMPREVAQSLATTYAKEIVPSFNAYLYFRFGEWLTRRVSRFLYRVRLNTAEDAGLDHVNPDTSVVFVMNHRSNVDYMLVTYLVANQTALSYAAGEWARFWPLHQLLRGLGAFFVRRNSSDPLYRKVLERYVQMATDEGVCQAVFLEGGLSRDGRLRTPKIGFLDYMMRAYDPDAERDIVFIPIGINYDHVLEDENLVRDLDPDADKRSAWGHVRAVLRFLRRNLRVDPRERWRRMGYAGVNFGVPVSAQDFCAARNIRPCALDQEQRSPHMVDFAGELMSAIEYVIPVLPVPLVCRALSDAGDTGLKSLEVFARTHHLVDTFISGGAAMQASEKPRQKTIVNALEMLRLRGLVTEENDVFRIASGHKALIDYYANSLAHFDQPVRSRR
jgi:glycerol-3-phosphate O-acyltransferase